MNALFVVFRISFTLSALQDIGCPRQLERSQVIHSVIERRFFSQVLDAVGPNNEVMSRSKVLLHSLGHIAFDHNFESGNAVLAVDDEEFTILHFGLIYWLEIHIRHDA